MIVYAQYPFFIGNIMYVYLVVLMLNGTYAVHTPNTVFSTKKLCILYKELDAKRLIASKVNDKARFFFFFLKLPEDPYNGA